MSTTSLDLRSRRPLWAVWAVSVGYVLAFLLLDWVSYIRPFQGLNITPWNPQAAVAIALLFWNRRCLPLVWIGLLAAELVVRGVPSNWFVTLAATAALGLSYAAIARAVEVRLDRSLALATLRDLLWLTGIIVTGALFSGTVYVSTYAVGGLGPTGPVVEAIVRYWVGDAVGMIVLLPMLLMLMDAHRRAALVQTLRDRQWWLIVALVVVLLWVVFAREDHDHFKYFYVLLLPVVWASARLGLTGAVLTAGLTQVGLIVSMQWVKNPDLSVFELQALMAVLQGESKTSSGFFTKQKRDALRMMHTPRTTFLYALRQGVGFAPVPGLGEDLPPHAVQRRHAGLAGPGHVDRRQVERQPEQVVAQRLRHELVELVADLVGRAHEDRARRLGGVVLR